MSSMQESKRPYNVFYSYADEDANLLKKLDNHLRILERQGEIKAWDKRNISAGREREREVYNLMNKSSIILLLISPNFFASDYSYIIEMTHAIKRRRENEAYIIPILLRPCVWDLEGLPLREYEVLPSNEIPITRWNNRDKAFEDVAQGIRKAVQNLREYEIKVRTKQVDPWQYIFPSIKSIQLTPKPQEIIQTSRTSPRTTNSAQNIKSKRNTNTQREAQIAQVRGIPLPWTKHPLPQPYTSPEELNIYGRGKSKDFYRIAIVFCLLLDVLGLAIVSGNLLQPQILPVMIFLLSAFVYLWGVFNISLYIAIILSTAYCILWLFIGFRYLHLQSGVLLTLSFAFLVARFLIFQGHQNIRGDKPIRRRRAANKR